ncbi:MAG: hypothetical protein LBL91_02945 [Lachnospiraceae bacterium]|jgi:hypothetical protein|nr:hypothetical protein [Lachnospiraceae bacterium]
MKDEEIKIEEELQNKKKLSKTLKQKLYKKIAREALVSILISVYAIFIYLGSININRQIYVTDLKVFSMSILIISIILFEKAYSKMSVELFVRAVEVLIVAIVTLFLKYLLFDANNNVFRMIPGIMAIAFFIYAIIKMIIYYVLTRKEHKQTISDVKDILKK